MKLLLLGACLLSSVALGDEFLTLVNGFGTTSTLVGVKHPTTSNPDGTAINFWNESSEGAPAYSVGLSNPHMAGADAYGNVYIADKASHAVLKITTNGLIQTLAGTHSSGFNGDGPAPATGLQISSPNGLFVLASGVVYLLDPGNHRIRRVGTDGIMTTIVNDTEPRWYPSGRALWVSADEKLIYYTHEIAPVPPGTVAEGAVVKQWSAARGIETVCSKNVGFRNPGNLAVNPVDGKLYVCDRAEEDATKLAMGLFRIDGPDQRSRLTGNSTQPAPDEGQLAIHSYLAEPRGIAFRADGSYFICGHKEGSIWFVDTQGILHKYLRGSAKKDGFALSDGLHPPLVDKDYFAQPRALTLAPNGNLLVVCNDSGYVFQLKNIAPPLPPEGLLARAQGLTGVRLQWQGTFGQGYRVERADVLSPQQNWQAVGAVGGSAAGKTEFMDPGALERAGFYRLRPAL